MKSNKPKVVLCCLCTRRENLVEVHSKMFCKWHDPLDTSGAQAEEYARRAAAQERAAIILGMVASVAPRAYRAPDSMTKEEVEAYIKESERCG